MKNTYICNRHFKVCKLIAAMVMLAAVTVTSCNTTVNTVPEQYPVAFTEDGGVGTLTATVDGKPLTSGASVFRDKTVVFTAESEAYYTIGKWAVSGGSFAESTGTEGNSSATVTITANTRVDIQFNPPVGLYHKIDYGTDGQALKDYLNSLLNGVSYIEITGLTKDMLQGGSFEGSPLGKIITQGKRNVALKFGDAEIAGLTSMDYSFKGCTKLVEMSNIPASVTDMERCFYGCAKLEQAPAIPENVTNMEDCFSDCNKLTAVTLKCAYNQNFYKAFYGCTGLQAGSITVPAHELNEYRANAGRMGVAADRFKAE